MLPFSLVSLQTCVTAQNLHGSVVKQSEVWTVCPFEGNKNVLKKDRIFE